MFFLWSLSIVSGLRLDGRALCLQLRVALHHHSVVHHRHHPPYNCTQHCADCEIVFNTIYTKHLSLTLYIQYNCTKQCTSWPLSDLTPLNKRCPALALFPFLPVDAFRPSLLIGKPAFRDFFYFFCICFPKGGGTQCTIFKDRVSLSHKVRCFSICQ